MTKLLVATNIGAVAPTAMVDRSLTILAAVPARFAHKTSTAVPPMLLNAILVLPAK